MITDPYYQAILATRDLLAYWRLGESSGTAAADASGNGYTGTYTGGFTLSQTGALADGTKATAFNGSTGHVSIASALVVSNAHSIETWHYESAGAITTFRALYSHQVASHIVSLLSTRKIRFSVPLTSGQQNVDSNATLQQGTWNHIVATWNGVDTICIYVNGALDQQVTGLSGVLNPVATTRYIGQDANGIADRFWLGTIDEVAIYTRALTAVEVAAHYRAAGITVGEKAYQYAVAGLCRSGGTRSDYYLPNPQITIGGVNRAGMIDKETLRIIVHERRAEFECFDFALSKGQEVVIALGTIGNRLFGGHVVDIEHLAANQHQRVRYKVTCFDYTWLLETRRITGRVYSAQSATNILTDLMSAYAPSGFTVANVEASMDNLDFTANHAETLWQAIQRLMKMASKGGRRRGYAYVDANKDLHAFVTPEASNSPTALTDTNRQYWDLVYRDGLMQTRSRAYVLGGTTQARSTVPNGSTALPVDATDKFGSSGGFALSFGNQISYTGTSPASGAGWLTGVTSLVYTIPQGESVRVLAIRVNSSTAQSLTARLGGDGLIDHIIEDERLSDDAARDRGDADLEQFALEDSVTFKSRDKFYTLNKTVPVSLTAPATIAAQMVIQGLTISGIGIGANPRFPIREVEAGMAAVDPMELLADVDQLSTEGPL